MSGDITKAQLAVLTDIVEYIQGKGWLISGVEINRYNKDDSPFADGEGEDWKPKEYEWYLQLRTGPRREEEVLAKKTEELR